MIYIIKRETMVPWDNTQETIVIEGSTYDIVESAQDTGLDSISEYILKDGVIVKSPNNKNQLFTEVYEKQTKQKIQELLLG